MRRIEGAEFPDECQRCEGIGELIEKDEPMPCPNCGAPLNIDVKGVEVAALCCGAELEPDANTLIDILPEVGESQ